MGNIFIKKVKIDNFRCFDGEEIIFNVPDGERDGSGLNILVGENCNGKTTILEAINYLTQSSYATENKLNINDFRDYSNGISISAETDEFRCKLAFPYKGYFECNGLNFSVKSRERKSPGKLLSSQYQIKNTVSNLCSNYKDDKGNDSGKDIPPLNLIYGNSNIDDGGINIFYFDKNRSRQLTSGNYRTSFDRICEDLNWKFIKNLDQDKHDDIVKNICGEFFKNVMDTAQKGTGEKLSEELSDFFNEKFYEDLKIELLDLLNPFNQAFFAIRKENELKQIKIKDLGSGVEIILTLLLLKNLASESKGSIIYLIDEPELHLHPKAQEKLINLLIKESKDIQIILSTHSQYLFKNCLNDINGIHIFNRDDKNKIQITYAEKDKFGLMPWSPTWGEINYLAFNMPGIELHNELYGYIQEKSEKYYIKDFEEYLVSKSINKTKKWTQLTNGNPQTSYDVTLCTYIRNTIHHPENTENDPYTEEELRESIDNLMKLCRD